MPHRGWWRRRGGVARPREHLSAGRLEDLVGNPDSTSTSTSSESAADTKVNVPKPKPAKHGVSILLSWMTNISIPVFWKPSVPISAVSKPAVSKAGRHRHAMSAKPVVWGFALTSTRLALMGALALLVVASAVLLTVS